MNTEAFKQTLRSIANRETGTCQKIKDLEKYHDELLTTIDSLQKKLNHESSVAKSLSEWVSVEKNNYHSFVKFLINTKNELYNNLIEFTRNNATRKEVILNIRKAFNKFFDNRLNLVNLEYNTRQNKNQ